MATDSMEKTPVRAEPFAAAPDQSERLLAGLCYASQIVAPAIVAGVLLATGQAQQSRYLRHHAAQSLGLLVMSLLYYLLATVAFIVAAAVVPCLGCLLWLLFLPPVAALLWYGYRAFMGEGFQIPWLGAFMRRNGWL
jgi:uncharacterized membrane protein